MPDGDRDEVADRLSRRFDEPDDGEGANQDEPEAEADPEPDPEPDVEDDTDDPSVPYGTSRTYRTPKGFEMADIDQTSVRDGADREVYMPPDLLDELDLAFDQLNLRYKTEFGQSLNKHPHWYNRLLVIGLAVVGDVSERDLDELQEELALPEPAED